MSIFINSIIVDQHSILYYQTDLIMYRTKIKQSFIISIFSSLVTLIILWYRSSKIIGCWPTQHSVSEDIFFNAFVILFLLVFYFVLSFSGLLVGAIIFKKIMKLKI